MSPRPLIPQRRERILDAAEALVLERGFDATSVQALAERVGIAKGAVYREFPGKDAVLDAVLERVSTRTLDRASASIEAGELPRLSIAYRAWTEALLDEPLLCAAFLDDEGVLGGAVERLRGDGRYRARHELVRAWVAELQRLGHLDDSVDADGLALALSSATLGLLTAGRTLGPLAASELRAALGALEAMVAALER